MNEDENSYSGVGEGIPLALLAVVVVIALFIFPLGDVITYTALAIAAEPLTCLVVGAPMVALVWIFVGAYLLVQKIDNWGEPPTSEPGTKIEIETVAGSQAIITPDFQFQIVNRRKLTTFADKALARAQAKPTDAA